MKEKSLPLSETHPDLAGEAYGWDPTLISAGSDKKLEWKCAKGHIWITRVYTRKYGSGCPFCSGRFPIVGLNDLSTTHPELAEEAHGWDPSTVSFGSDKKLEWKCQVGHTWKANVGSRARLKSGCPVCINQKVLAGFNDLATTHPEIALQAHGWDPTKVIAGTNRKLEWKCQEGHIWKASGNDRKRFDCPSCSKTGFDPNLPAYLYFLHQNDWEIYQIGITNVPETRLKKHKRNGFEVYEIRGPMDGYLTQEIEQSIIKFLKSKKVNLPSSNLQGKFDGYTESWTMESFKVNNLKELIDMASDAGF